SFDTSFNGASDVFVSKLNPTGSMLLYSTFVGGSEQDSGRALDLDAAGNVYVTGITQSPNFPATSFAFDTTYNQNNDAFVFKLNNTGSALVYATFLGGSGDDSGSSIAVDPYGNAHVTGLLRMPSSPRSDGQVPSLVK